MGATGVRHCAMGILATMCLGLAGCAAMNGASRDLRTFRNPLDVAIADPFVLQDEGTYYLYGTASPTNTLAVWSSEDLVHWRRRGQCYQPTADSWGRIDLWAPEVVKNDDRYYLFFVVHNPKAGMRNICVAMASSPLGPFKELRAPLFPDGPSVIDPHVFQDPTDGQYYIYVTHEDLSGAGSRMLVAPLSDSMVEVESPLTECLLPDQAWEDNWIEAPFVIRHGDSYYMMYSGNAYSESLYSIGYATAPHPLGPWTKYPGNPALRKSPTVHGPGHNSVALSPDGEEMFIVYHQHFSPWTIGRALILDRLTFKARKDGPDLLCFPGAPNSAPQPLPSGARPLCRGQSDEFDGDSLDFTRWMTYGENPETWRLDTGALVITTEPGDIYGGGETARNVFLQYAPDGDFSISAKVQFAPKADFEQAVILIWQDQDNYVKLASVHTGGARFEAGAEFQGKYDNFLIDNRLGDSYHLRLDRKGTRYQCSVSADGATWTEVGPGFESDLSPIKAGFGAWSPGSGARLDARFESFTIDR